MYYKFLKYIKQNKLFFPSNKILLAVSGGRDSMAMVDLFEKAGFKYAIAHFNHTTRDGESDIDELFVKEYCVKNNIEFYSVKVDIRNLLNKGQGNNFQDIARRYRYRWLEKIRKENNFDYIATAHHKDDNIETFLFKISKGAGVYGLTGINTKTGKIIRPILDISRDEINDYIKKNHIAFREDSTNKNTDYTRNFIRHKIVPAFKEFNKNFEHGIALTIQNIQHASKALTFLVDNYMKEYIHVENNITIIKKNLFDKLPKNKEVIYYFFSKYDFNNDQVLGIIHAIDNVGARFYSNKWELLIDRNALLIRKKNPKKLLDINIETGLTELPDGEKVVIRKLNMGEKIDLKNGLYLNGDMLSLPLRLRKWQPGDKFKPFGLKGKNKKIKDFFTDKKISGFDKDNALILLNNDEICAIIPYDISYDYRVSNETNDVIQITYLS